MHPRHRPIALFLFSQLAADVARDIAVVLPLELPPDYDPDDLLPTVREGLSLNGRLYALPFYAESSMLMLRSDLAQKAGVSLPERIVTNDPLQRRLQYRIEAGPVRAHLATLDVIDLGDDTCLGVYSTDAEPDVMALVIGAACGNALEELRRQFDDGERTY